MLRMFTGAGLLYATKERLLAPPLARVAALPSTPNRISTAEPDLGTACGCHESRPMSDIEASANL